MLRVGKTTTVKPCKVRIRNNQEDIWYFLHKFGLSSYMYMKLHYKDHSLDRQNVIVLPSRS